MTRSKELLSAAFVSLLSLGMAMPAVAQPLTEQEARKIAEGIEHAFDKAFQAHDAAVAAALQTDDVIRVTGAGETLLGREANEKWFAKILQHWDADPGKVDQVRVMSNDVVVATGFWSGIWHGDNGPAHAAGRWMDTYVHVGGTWKVAVVMASDTPQK